MHCWALNSRATIVGALCSRANCKLRTSLKAEWTRYLDMPDITIRPNQCRGSEWVAQFILEHWGSTMAISRGVVHYPQNLPGFVALYKGEKVGLVTYTIVGRTL